jgi:two-component system response regulator AtoC
MENAVDRALILADHGQVTVADLPPALVKGALAGRPELLAAGSGASLREQVRAFEHSLIARAIADCGGDRRAAAHKLGIGVSSLYRKLEEFDSLGLPSAAEAGPE